MLRLGSFFSICLFVCLIILPNRCIVCNSLSFSYDTFYKQHRNHITTFYAIDFSSNATHHYEYRGLCVYFFVQILAHCFALPTTIFLFSHRNKSLKRIESYHKMIVCASKDIQIYWKMTKKLVNARDQHTTDQIENNHFFRLVLFSFGEEIPNDIWFVSRFNTHIKHEFNYGICRKRTIFDIRRLVAVTPMEKEMPWIERHTQHWPRLVNSPKYVILNANHCLFFFQLRLWLREKNTGLLSSCSSYATQCCHMWTEERQTLFGVL